MSTNHNNDKKTDISAWVSEKISKLTAKDIGSDTGESGFQRSFKNRILEIKAYQDIKENENIVKEKQTWSGFTKKFLIYQYVVIVSVLALNGFHWMGFYLSDGVIYSLMAATIIESFSLTRIIFGHLYTSRNKTHR